jgi:hypothetical protein
MGDADADADVDDEGKLGEADINGVNNSSTVAERAGGACAVAVAAIAAWPTLVSISVECPITLVASNGTNTPMPPPPPPLLGVFAAVTAVNDDWMISATGGTAMPAFSHRIHTCNTPAHTNTTRLNSQKKAGKNTQSYSLPSRCMSINTSIIIRRMEFK